LASAGVLSPQEAQKKREAINEKILEMAKQVKEEPLPEGSTIYDHVYAGQKVDTLAQVAVAVVQSGLLYSLTAKSRKIYRLLPWL
jgi:TPP-dependent pyruvate/acetoin dehydrogenase alpha subunit